LKVCIKIKSVEVRKAAALNSNYLYITISLFLSIVGTIAAAAAAAAVLVDDGSSSYLCFFTKMVIYRFLWCSHKNMDFHGIPTKRMISEFHESHGKESQASMKSTQ
jgi:hypothetical protein